MRVAPVSGRSGRIGKHYIYIKYSIILLLMTSFNPNKLDLISALKVLLVIPLFQDIADTLVDNCLPFKLSKASV